MKNKKAIYILLPLVLLIWAMVIYQFFSFSGSDAVAVNNNKAYTIKPINIPVKDTFTINVNYRDPFLGKMYLPNNNKTSISKKTKPKPAEPIIMPHIIYKGIVSDNQNEKKVFMVIIKGQTFLMKEKDTEQEVTLKNGNREYIEVVYKGQKNKIVIQS
ncbi:hypothetical protein E0W68_09410 [Flavobacterium salilacus subsp. salilacus]|uniref:hypothetical protein n=1 Tax=Flavobacterium TaxID=237 RepID=UPI001074D658|nr:MULTISPECIES: hypothetical protein [Flavobacterium]KAF2518529.1 hypothetical protein E0W68_09410 [Flavobacterium salilacus subsp. salilacus]MBE1615172.1 hypothetical protein [Flavobacterium sp. SaA2.13]